MKTLYISLVTVGLLFLHNCKPDKKVEEDLSGSYDFIFTGNSYWCETVKRGTKDSIVYYGYYTFTTQPFTKHSNAELTKISKNCYKICLDVRANCSDTNFYSNFEINTDSIEFGKNFCVFDKINKVLFMKGILIGINFRGKYQRYTTQEIPTTSNPHDNTYVGTFELTKK